jgi:hypothetical protein
VASPFATTTDLTDRGVTVSNPTMATAFLEDASEFLRGEIGWQVYPAAQATISYLNGGHTCKAYEMEHVHLPGSPIRGITSVTMVGQTVDPSYYELVDDVLIVGAAYWYYVQNVGPHWLPVPVVITYQVGYDTPPAELVSWTCIIAAQMLDKAAQSLSLGATPASLGVDDFKVQFSAQQQSGDMPIPQRVLDRLRDRYGQTVFVA